MLKKWLILTVSVCCLLCVVACDSGFKKLVERQTTELHYAGVREDLTVVSNVHNQLNLIDLGLNENAYFLYGDGENMYFGTQGGFYTKNDVWSNDTNQWEVVVMRYNFEEETLTRYSSLSSANRVMMKDENSIIYGTYRRKGALGYFDYYCDVRELNASGNVVSSETFEMSSNTQSNIDQWVSFYLNNYVGKLGYWTNSSTLYWLGNYYEPFNITETDDEVWIQTGEKAFGSSVYEPNNTNYAVIQRDYRGFFKEYRVYYAYDIGGDVEFIFAEDEDVSEPIALYVF